MEELHYPISIPMERTGKIMRRSIHTFLQNYQYFTTTALLLALPFSASVLLTQALLPSSPLLPRIYYRLANLFDAAGFPPSSEFFTILCIKLSQTITSSTLVLPFTLSFLLLAKASVFHYLNRQKQKLSSSFSFLSIYKPLFLTQICSSLILLAANATTFSLLFIAFNCLEGSGYASWASLFLLSTIGAVLYSLVLANTLTVCNLALVSSGMDKCVGFLAIFKACFLIRGRTATALALALPVSITLAAVEALFHFRVVTVYFAAKSLTPSLALEGVFIASLYSTVVVIDAIVSFLFFKSCKRASQMDQEAKYTCRIEIDGKDVGRYTFETVKTFEDLP